MNSSTEGLQPSGYHQESNPSGPPSSASEEAPSDVSEDDDGNSTALGITNNEPVFTPQPNAFSHPPLSTQARTTHPSSIPNSYFPAQHPPPTRSTRHSYPTQRPRSHTPYSLISPSYRIDHDAALRASLSTLLSCAAAARALPKRDQPVHPTSTSPPPSSRIDPSSLRILPESALPSSSSPPRRPRSPSSSSTQEKGKRKASSSKDRRVETRKKRRAGAGEDVGVSPTLMTWVVSAGVVVLFSAISFSAGYAIGREVGRVEAGAFL